MGECSPDREPTPWPGRPLSRRSRFGACNSSNLGHRGSCIGLGAEINRRFRKLRRCKRRAVNAQTVPSILALRSVCVGNRPFRYSDFGEWMSIIAVQD